MGRSPCCAKVGLNKGSWTSAEDKILTDFINLNGEGRWRSLPKRAGLKRCGKSCRLRWLNYLRPDIKRGNISDDEEDLIIRLHKLLGNRWSLIAGRLPGRTDNEIKNYWNTTLRKKNQDNHSSSVSFPKTRKTYKKKRDRSESTQHNVVESEATQKTKTSESPSTSSNPNESQPILQVEPVITELPTPPLKDDNPTLNLEPNIDPSDICLNEFLNPDFCGLFESDKNDYETKNTTSNLSSPYERPIMEILEEIWSAEDIDVDTDLINSTANNHYFDSVSECIGDWLL